jgi:hypothetical protein
MAQGMRTEKQVKAELARSEKYAKAHGQHDLYDNYEFLEGAVTALQWVLGVSDDGDAALALVKGTSAKELAFERIEYLVKNILEDPDWWDFVRDREW